MKLILGAVGRLKAGPERDLAARYLERARAAGRPLGLTGPDVRELEESRARRPDDRKADEAKALLGMLPAGARIVALDERGASVSSEDFAAALAKARDDGAPAFALFIGGPDGLDEDIRRHAHLTLAFGAMTWPHQLVRVMAAEQIYRAITILSGHPYHRA
ncbi:MAG: 23S rRNA (pseudouridine(1915)-N(3))-methyltransferase RlmH [Beijerinckiaceae bacterium]